MNGELLIDREGTLREGSKHSPLLLPFTEYAFELVVAAGLKPLELSQSERSDGGKDVTNAIDRWRLSRLCLVVTFANQNLEKWYKRARETLAYVEIVIHDGYFVQCELNIEFSKLSSLASCRRQRQQRVFKDARGPVVFLAWLHHGAHATMANIQCHGIFNELATDTESRIVLGRQLVS